MVKKRLWKILKIVAWVAFGLALLSSLAPDDSIWGYYSIAAALVLFSPFVLFIALQGIVWIYVGLRYGNMMYEPAPPNWDRTRVVYVTEPRKIQKKYCPICKRKTRCKISTDRRFGRIPFHRQRD